MDSEDGQHFVKQLAAFVRTHEKALANALQFQRRDARHRSSQSASAVPSISQSSTALTEHHPPSSPTTNPLAAAFSLGSLNFTSHSTRSAKLALTPHHLFYLLSRFEELSINVGPMKVRLENLHDTSFSTNYVSFLGNTGRSRSRSSDVGSIHSVSSVRSIMSGMSSLWASFGIGASISAARTERHKAALEADLKYLYSAFTKIPCLKLAPDWRAHLIRGYEEFPFDSAVPLYVFKNLQALEVRGIDFRQFFGWDRLADQLRSLSLRHACIDDPADILVDIVLDDMDKRRRRTSKAQSSPAATWGPTNSPRRSPTLLNPEPVRAASAPGTPDTRNSLADLGVPAATANEPAVEDDDVIDVAGSQRYRAYTERVIWSPASDARPRSNSPSRPASSRNHSSLVRSSQRIKRSESGSSHSSLSETWHHHTRANSGSAMGHCVLPASKWRFLRHLSLADNAITSISPTSLAALSNTLFSLDLSSNLFSQIPDSLATLTALRALNLSHCMIDSLQSITRNPLPAISALNLRANRLQSLAGIEKLYPLERLDLRDNRLADPLELARLTGIPDLREIWVEGNPFARTHKGYRVTIFNLFRATPGNTVDMVIDGCGPSYSERRQLIERAPMPDSVPVVKPAVVGAPAVVEIKKPNALHEAHADSNLPRLDGSRSRDVSGEVGGGSTRRRKVPRRRIVDLAATDGAVITDGKGAECDGLRAEVGTEGAKAAKVWSASGKHSIDQATGAVLQPAVVLTSRGSKADRTGDGGTALEERSNPETTTGDGRGGAQETQDWDVGGEIYRRKIEALRDRVGSGYLSVLSEESWDGYGGYTTASVPAVPRLGASHVSHYGPPAQAVHSGGTLG